VPTHVFNLKSYLDVGLMLTSIMQKLKKSISRSVSRSVISAKDINSSN
jgi:hypothetical protein